MTNKEAAEYLIRDLDDVRDLLTGIAKTHPKVTKGLRPAAAHVVALAEDGRSKATIVLSHQEVTAFHASEFEEEIQMWNKTTLNLGSKYNPDAIPAQVMHQDSVHQPRIGLPIRTLEDIPQEICDRLYGAVALFGAAESE
jgi:hypothetical protein